MRRGIAGAVGRAQRQSRNTLACLHREIAEMQVRLDQLLGEDAGEDGIRLGVAVGQAVLTMGLVGATQPARAVLAQVLQGEA